MDVRYNFQAGGEQWDLVVGGNRTDEMIDIFRVDTEMLGICFFTLGENTPSAPHQEGEKGVDLKVVSSNPTPVTNLKRFNSMS